MKEHNLDEKVLSRTTANDARTATHDERAISDLTQSYWQGPADGRSESLAPNERLVEASKRIQQLNKELHEAGGPLAGSDLQLIGFDRKGRLLMIQRNDEGKVDGKFLIDGDSGKIVARTKQGSLDIWEKSTAYEKSSEPEKQEKSEKSEESERRHPEGWQCQQTDGASIWRDEKGNIREVLREKGDFIQVETDSLGNPAMVRMGSNLWPLRADGPYPHAEMRPDGTLQVWENENLYFCALPSGAAVQYNHDGGHWMPVQTLDPYGSLRVINRNELGAPVQITIMNGGGESETYRYKDPVPGVTSSTGFWVKQPETPGAPMTSFMIDADGSLKHFIKADQSVEYKTNGEMISTGPGGKQTIVRPAFSQRGQTPEST